MLLILVRLILAGIVGYLAGSFPSGVIVGKVRGVDVLAQGSGHTGATNVLRTAGGGAAATVVVLDLAKGAIAVLLAHYLIFPQSVDGTFSPWAESVAGLTAILGHNFSVFLRFRGGRGVAVGGGATLAVNAPVMLIATVLGAIPVIFTRYVSLGSITAAITAPLLDLVFIFTNHDSWAHFTFILAGGLIIIFSHYDNIQRLLAGTERKLGQRVKTEAPSSVETKP